MYSVKAAPFYQNQGYPFLFTAKEPIFFTYGHSNTYASSTSITLVLHNLTIRVMALLRNSRSREINGTSSCHVMLTELVDSICRSARANSSSSRGGGRDFFPVGISIENTTEGRKKKRKEKMPDQKVQQTSEQKER